MKYVAAGTTVAIERPGLHHLLGVMECPTPEIAQREAARMNAELAAPVAPPPHRRGWQFDGDQAVLQFG